MQDWADWLPGADHRAEVLPGWDVATLAAHLVVVGEGVVDGLGRPGRPPALPALTYVSGYAAAAAEIDELARRRAAEIGTELAGALTAAAERVRQAADGPHPAVVAGPRGPLAVADWVATRLLDAVVHTDDLHRAVPSAEPPPVPRPALAQAVRSLLGWLAAEHPGQTLEVRVPPHGAVQCGVEGSTLAHTRGTPPNVVETDPVTFLRLCTGRLGWQDARAAGRVSASGHRADLSGWLPLLS
nr:sterol carrier family protein [Auraticoccus cholistanensis]